MNILFFKKFGGNSERERIIIFVMESFDKMDWCNQDKYLYLRIPCYNCNTFRVDLTCKSNIDFYHWNYINPYWACGLTKKLRQQTRLDV